MKTLETSLLGVGFFALVAYLLRRAFIGNKNILVTGKFSFKDEFRAAGKVLLAVLPFLIYTALIFILFEKA